MCQATANLASKLGLAKNDTDTKKEDMRMVTQIKNWLNSSGQSFLLIFENVENINTLFFFLTSVAFE